MPHTSDPFRKKFEPDFDQLYQPVQDAVIGMTPLESRCRRPLQMSFDEHLRAPVCFHLEEHTSARHSLQIPEEDDFAREVIAPKDGIKKSGFSEAANYRGLERFLYVFQNLQKPAAGILPGGYPELGELVAIDGSLIDSVLSMDWADCRKGAEKAEVHVGSDLNRTIPRKVFLTDGKGAERPFVSRILSPGETGVMDRGYRCHESFDSRQKEKKHFVCRIKAETTKTIVEKFDVDPDSIVFFDAIVLLGAPAINRTRNEVRLVGYKVDGVDYQVATDRFDLTAEQIALIYKLRWDIEKFFARW